MPKGIPSAGRKQSNTKKAIKEFKKWNEERYPIYDEAGNQLILKEDEFFVEAWDYSRKKKDTNGYCFIKVRGQKAFKREKYNYRLQPGESFVIEPKFDPYYYISNYGNVLSFKFHGTNKPLLMAQTEGTNGYMQVSDAWRTHKIVWFSFMADAIKRIQRDPDDALPYELPLFYGYEVQTLQNLKLLTKLDDVEIHHRNTNVKDNSLENLEVLPDDIHDLLTRMKNAKDEDEKWSMLLESDSIDYYDSKASVFVTDEDDVVAYALDQKKLWEKFSPEAKQAVADVYWSEIVKYIFEQTVQVVEYDFFSKDIFMSIKLNDTYSFFKFQRNQAGNIEVEQLTMTDVINIDFDIFYDNGKIYLPNYVIE